ncbi:transferase [Burkholderia sp. SFA1]|uniref:rhodanese-like domain-containing protein n=1 Tax=Caballeronia sp. CLC5 TaxID=2906764 RepID=UPI001F1FB6FA|nr:rhodanese-like domain-containing protein [Caballeronia sp. CLC5]MCE4573526.1 sulfurtransferase [Caballeronia sp. CLC5]BBQ00369.1 transferase [Burkholderia sp. SFA1]
MTASAYDVNHIGIDTLLDWLGDEREIALVDVREEGEFGWSHPLHAINVPYSTLERDIATPVPRLSTRIVLIDDGVQRVAIDAARRLAALGYGAVAVLEGGVAAWRDAGQTLFEGVNVPSKAFAECVELAYHTPQLDPQELQARRAKDSGVVVLDCRTAEEFERFHVPGAISAPGAELLHLVDAYLDDPERTIVVSCAGRTRGIIGAQALINAGVRNPVFALRGGTQAWRRAGFELESGASPAALAHAAPGEAAQARAASIAARFDVRWIDHAQLRDWQGDPARTTYLFDVRTAAEFDAGHVAGSVHASGGQLVQTTDRWIGTRHARTVLVDEHRTRAVVTAHWLAQLGIDVYVLRAPFEGVTLVRERHGADFELSWAGQHWIDPLAAAQRLSEGAAGFVAGSSAAYRTAHPAGAEWINRARVDAVVDALRDLQAIVVFGDDDTLAALLAIDLREHLPHARVECVRGGLAAWRAAQLPVESTPQHPADDARIDYLFWAHDRHEGNVAAITKYLQWEEQLPAQIGDAARAGYRLRADAVLGQ